MNKSIPDNFGFTTEQVEQLRKMGEEIQRQPAFKKLRRRLLNSASLAGLMIGRGRTMIPVRVAPRTQARARRSPASTRRATSDSGGSDGDGGDPEPPRPSLLYSLSAYAYGGAP